MLTQKPNHTLGDIPVDESGVSRIIMEFVGYEPQTFKSLFLTSKGINTLFHQPKDIEAIACNALLQAIIDGQEDIVVKILKGKPELLLKTPDKNLVIESSLTGLRFYAEEPLKMALKTKQSHIVECMLPYFDSDKIKNGKEEALKQWNACEVSEEVKKEKAQKYLKEMYTLIDEIIKENGTAAISNFRKKLLPAKDKTIRLDDLDVEALLTASYQAYYDKFYNFENGRTEYCIQAIGLLQRLQFRETAEVFCQGLYNVVVKRELIDQTAKSLKLVKDTDIAYYHPCKDFTKGLGVDFFVGMFGERHCQAVHRVKSTGEVFRVKTIVFNELKNKLESGNLSNDLENPDFYRLVRF